MSLGLRVSTNTEGPDEGQGNSPRAGVTDRVSLSAESELEFEAAFRSIQKCHAMSGEDDGARSDPGCFLRNRRCHPAQDRASRRGNNEDVRYHDWRSTN